MVPTRVGAAGVHLDITVTAGPGDGTVALVTIGLIYTAAMYTRVTATLVNVDLTVLTSIARHTQTVVAAEEVITGAKMLAGVRLTVVLLGLAPCPLVTIGA